MRITQQERLGLFRYNLPFKILEINTIIIIFVNERILDKDIAGITQA